MIVLDLSGLMLVRGREREKKEAFLVLLKSLTSRWINTVMWQYKTSASVVGRLLPCHFYMHTGWTLLYFWSKMEPTETVKARRFCCCLLSPFIVCWLAACWLRKEGLPWKYVCILYYHISVWFNLLCIMYFGVKKLSYCVFLKNIFW